MSHEEPIDVIPVTSLDDEQQTAHAIQKEDFGSPDTLNPDLIQVSHNNEAYSPALQLESSLNESVNDSYAHPDGVMKLPQLESTRISVTCAPGEFDPDGDLSKVQSEAGDSHNPLNAGFIKPQDNQSSSRMTSSAETSVFADSDSFISNYFSV